LLWHKPEVIVRLSPVVPTRPDERHSLGSKNIDLLRKIKHPSSMGINHPSFIDPLVRVTHPSLTSNRPLRGLLSHWESTFRCHPSPPPMLFRDLTQEYQSHLWYLGLNTRPYEINMPKEYRLFVRWPEYYKV